MTKSDQNNEQLSAVLMFQYGMEMCVLTPHSNLENIRNQLSNNKRWTTGNPKRHRFLFERMRSRLIDEDKYFTENPLSRFHESERWGNFNNDCVFLAVLGVFLFETTIILMHPSAFESNLTETDRRLIGSKKPSLIDGIDIQFEQ